MNVWQKSLKKKSKKAREPALTNCHLRMNETQTENQTEPKENRETVKKPTISSDDQGKQNLGVVVVTTEIPAESLKSSSWEMASYLETKLGINIVHSWLWEK